MSRAMASRNCVTSASDIAEFCGGGGGGVDVDACAGAAVVVVVVVLAAAVKRCGCDGAGVAMVEVGVVVKRYAVARLEGTSSSARLAKRALARACCRSLP